MHSVVKRWLALFAATAFLLSDGIAVAAPTGRTAPSNVRGRTRLATAFAPTQIGNLQAWYDASSASGVTQSGGVVSGLNDLSGNGNGASQTTVAAQPTLVSSGINNLPSLVFGGSQYLLTNNAAFSSDLFNESTVFAVTNESTTPQDSVIAWSGTPRGVPRYKFALSTSATAPTTNGYLQYDINNNKVPGEIRAHVAASGTALWSAAGSVASNAQYVRRDGATISSTTGPASALAGSYPLAIGAVTSGTAVSNRYSGQLGEVLVFNRYLLPNEYTEVEGYLACKWGLQSQLPASHPYATTCPGSAPPLSVSPSVLTFVSPTSPSANASINGGTPPFTVTGCSTPSIAQLTVSNATLTVTPVAAGSCTATVVDSANVTTTESVTVNAASTGGGPFAPTQLSGLQSWFDASVPSGVTQSGGSVRSWNDLSGNNNTVAQTSATAAPGFVAAGINGLGSLSFNGSAYLLGSNGSFSTDLFNESTTFVVSNQTNPYENSVIAWSGPGASSPRYKLSLSNSTGSGSRTQFDFNSITTGDISHSQTVTGPTIWTAAGSVSTSAEFFRRDGTTFGSTTGPGAVVSGNYPLSVGAAYRAGSVANGFTGQLGEMLVYNRMLAASEYAEIEGYLACKWGLQSQLPASHPYATTCPQGPGNAALQDPPQLRSSGGALAVTLVANQNAAGAPQLTYNGSPIAPTLRLLAGDTLNVTLINNLPAMPANSPYLNDTNLHFHGLHVSPNAPGDDSIDMIAMPGQTLNYQIAIPAGHPSGLYWYHSHAHGEAERQTLAGMSGALIIDGISASYPSVSSMTERILIARDAVPNGGPLPAANRKQIAAMLWAMRHGTSVTKTYAKTTVRATVRAPMNGMRGMSMDVPVRGRSNRATLNPYVTVDPNYRRFRRPAVSASGHCTTNEAPSKVWTLNGQTTPSIALKPGEQQFWRVVNAGSDNYLDLQVDGSQLQILAIDGQPLAQPLTVGDYVLPPSSRAEFVVTGPPSGTATFHTNCYDGGPGAPAMPAAVLATLNASASAMIARASARLRHRDRVRNVALRTNVAIRRVHSAKWLRTQAITGPTQTVNYSDQNTINGTAYSPSAPPLFYVQSGTVAEWTVINDSSQVHTFHIHQLHFLLEQVTGGTASDQVNVGQLMDNVNVPAATANGPGTVLVKLDFTDPILIGTFLMHCHILSHEDAGMMAKVRVGTAPPMSVSPSQVNFASPTAPSQTVTITGGSPGANGYSVSGCPGVNAVANGTTITISPLSSGACVLTVADATGLSSNVQIFVAAAAAAITISPNGFAFTAPGAPTQNATIAGGTGGYGVSGCPATIATAAIVSTTTLSVTPQGAGQCTLTVTDSSGNSSTAGVQVQSSAGGLPMDNLTFHHDATRSGWSPNETALTPATVGSSAFARLATLQAPAGSPAFGKVYAQPLYVTSERVADGSSHNLVIVATATDQVYAFDDRTYAVVWQKNFTGSGVTQQLSSTISCGDVTPNIGITGTPVIDRTLDELFVVVPTSENGVAHMRIHALSLANGNDVVAPTEVSASTQLSGGGVATTSALYNFQRSGLLEANGNIYVALASHCDHNANVTHGWMLAYTTASLQPSGAAVDLSNLGGLNYYLGSPWMSGYGPAADKQGNVYFATGNGPYDGSSSFSMSVLGLPGNLDISRAQSFTPATEANDNNADRDLGSGGVVLLPDGFSSTFPHLLVQGGKGSTSGASYKYVLNRDNLGGFTANDAGAISRLDTHVSLWGGPAVFQTATGALDVIYSGSAPGEAYERLIAYQLNPSSLTLSPQSQTPNSVGGKANGACFECRDHGAQPVVSSNGTTAGTAVMWALQTPNGGGTITLFAFDASNLNTTLFSAQAGTWLAQLSIAGALVSPLVANGRVYVPTDGSVAVFGLH